MTGASVVGTGVVALADLRHALGELCVDAPEGLYASPKSARQLAQVLAVLKAHGAALQRDVKLSRAGFDRLEGVDPRSCTAHAGAGIVLSALERALQPHALTLGPLSPAVQKLTLGEFLEGPYGGLRAIAGGRLEPLCVSLEAVLAEGHVMRTHFSPRSAAGPDLNALVLGGEGRLAVVVSARVRCFPVAEVRRTVRWSYPSVDAALSGMKAALSEGCQVGQVRAQKIGERSVLEWDLWGTVDGVERDAASIERLAPALGGRASGETPSAPPVELEREVTWAAVARVLETGAPSSAGCRPLTRRRRARWAGLEGPALSRRRGKARRLAHRLRP